MTLHGPEGGAIAGSGVYEGGGRGSFTVSGTENKLEFDYSDQGHSVEIFNVVRLLSGDSILELELTPAADSAGVAFHREP